MKIKMIAITGDRRSDYYSSICTSKFRSMGYNVEKFEATTPDRVGETMRINTELQFADSKFNGNRWTGIEIAIWYSHLRMWESITEPTYVVEHDTYPYKALPEFDGHWGLFSVFPRNEQAWQGETETISPGSGYYITKQSASILRDTALAQPITENVDGHIHQTVKTNMRQKGSEFNDYWVQYASCFQIVNYNVGTSAEHNV